MDVHILRKEKNVPPIEDYMIDLAQSPVDPSLSTQVGKKNVRLVLDKRIKGHLFWI